MRRLDLFSPIMSRTDGMGEHSSTDQRRYHVFRRITGYHNAIDIANPPDYDEHVSKTSPNRISDALPSYSCSVASEGVVQMRMERPDPFHKYNNALWEPVHIKLQGTLLQISTAKQHGIFTHSSKRGQFTGEPGRLVRSYTLQHAEIGLASDFKKYEIVPKSPMAALLPDTALKQLYDSDPDSFVLVYNHVARIRVEEVQFCLRFGNADDRAEWIDRICAAIDIAPPLEARSEPRNHTLPRRRRRREAAAAATTTQDQAAEAQTAAGAAEAASTDAQPAEGISDAARQEDDGNVLAQVTTAATHDGDDDGDGPAEGEGEGDGEAETEQEAGQQSGDALHAEQEPDPDRDDLDLAFMRGSERAAVGSTSNDGAFSDAWTETPWKFDPAPELDPIREARYRRRCMPVLVSNSKYANDIIMHRGKRTVIDWEKQTLQLHSLQPPSYSRSVSESAVPPAASAILTGADTAEGAPSNRLGKLLRQASGGIEGRALSRFRTKDAIPENASTEGTDNSRSSEDTSSPSQHWKATDAGNWSRRLRALATTARGQDEPHQQPRATSGDAARETPSAAEQQHPPQQATRDAGAARVIAVADADAGLILAPAARSATEPFAPPPQRSHDKTSRVLGSDAPSPSTIALTQPDLSRSPSVMSDPIFSSVEPDEAPRHMNAALDSPSRRRPHLPRKASALLGSISQWPSSPGRPSVSRSQSVASRISNATSSSRTSGETPSTPQQGKHVAASSLSLTTVDEAAASPTVSNTSSSHRPQHRKLVELAGSEPGSAISPVFDPFTQTSSPLFSPVSPVTSTTTRRPKPSPISPVTPAGADGVLEMSALPRTPRSFSSPVLSLPQKRMTAETGLIPVPSSPPPVPKLPSASASESGATPTPERATTLADRAKASLGVKRSSSTASELPGSPTPAAAVGGSSRNPLLRGLRREAATAEELPGSPASAPGSASGGSRLKRIQSKSSDPIPTRPRHHDKAFRTLGIV